MKPLNLGTNRIQLSNIFHNKNDGPKQTNGHISKLFKLPKSKLDVDTTIIVN